MCTLGKIVGGGFPVGCLAGRAEVMSALAPLGPVYQAGTLSGNPVAMEAGLATLSQLEWPGVYERLEAGGARLQAGLERAVANAQAPCTVNRAGSPVSYTHLLDADGVRELDRALVVKQGPGAVEHLFRVVSSLDSLVLGEAQIIGQVRRAFAAAEDAGAVGETTRRLFRSCLLYTSIRFWRAGEACPRKTDIV